MLLQMMSMTHGTHIQQADTTMDITDQIKVIEYQRYHAGADADGSNLRVLPDAWDCLKDIA